MNLNPSSVRVGALERESSIEIVERGWPAVSLPITPGVGGLALVDFRERTTLAVDSGSQSERDHSKNSLLNVLTRYYWDKKVQILYSLCSSIALSIPANKLGTATAHALGASDLVAYSAGALASTVGWYLGFYTGLSIESRFKGLKDATLSSVNKFKQALFGIVEGKNLLHYAADKAFTFGVTTLVMESLWFASLIKSEMIVSKWLQTTPAETAPLVQPFISLGFMFLTPVLCDLVDYAVTRVKNPK